MIVNTNSIVRHVIQIKNAIMKQCYSNCKKGHSWNLGTSICENTIYLKSIADTSVSACDKNISVTDIVSPKKAIL